LAVTAVMAANGHNPGEAGAIYRLGARLKNRPGCPPLF
jgi:hypothetical protein